MCFSLNMRRSLDLSRATSGGAIAKKFATDIPLADTEKAPLSFRQPGLPQSFFVSQKVFGPPKRAQHVSESGNT